MKPVAIFRHSPIEGPGYFAIFLEQQGISWKLIAIDEGENLPVAVDDFSGLCFMGGPMSVNDPLPWIDAACDLIRQAAAKNIPVLGHCLGGQLMSKAFGGQISANPVKEIGWSEVFGETSETACHWLGEFASRAANVFQWHGETFSLPNDATRLFTNAQCANQMFALGPHLGMQCHVEMTQAMIAAWSAHGADEIAAVAGQASVQTAAQMMAESSTKLPAMRQLADQLYTVWCQGLQH